MPGDNIEAKKIPSSPLREPGSKEEEQVEAADAAKAAELQATADREAGLTGSDSDDK